MPSTNALVQVLQEYQFLAESQPTRGQLLEAASAVPPLLRDCRADEEFRESLTPRQREVLDDGHEGWNEDDGGTRRYSAVEDVIGMQVDVSAQYKVTCNSYKEMLGKIKMCELDVMLEDRHIEELRLDSLDVKYTINDTLAKMTMHQEPALPEATSC